MTNSEGVDAETNAELRRARTRHLIEVGGLVVKAGIDSLTETQLLGGLCEIRDIAEQPSVLERWAERGRVEMVTSRAPHRRQASARFWRRLEAFESDQIRAAGFRWDRATGTWRGAVAPDAARSLIETFGGEFSLKD